MRGTETAYTLAFRLCFFVSPDRQFFIRLRFVTDKKRSVNSGVLEFGGVGGEG